MRATSKLYRSAPERELARRGSKESFEFLMHIAQGLTDKDLVALERDINDYCETGLIGVNMSRILALLKQLPPATTQPAYKGRISPTSRVA